MNVLATAAKIKTLLGVSVVAIVVGCASTDERRSTGQFIDDATITTKIEASLLADAVTDGLDIEVEVNRGRVQLTGFADSSAEVERAGEISRNTKGVSSVDNELRIAEEGRSAGQYIDDKVLVGKVNAALVGAEDVSALDIQIEVNRGVVILGGFVGSSKERNAAGQATRAVAGVKSVENELKIR